MIMFHLSRRHISVVGILLAGLGLSVAAFSIARSQENQRIRLRLTEQIDSFKRKLERSIEAKLEVAKVISAFYAASSNVTRAEFRVFSQTFFRRHQGIHALSWVQRVPLTERRQYEQTLTAEGFPNFSIYWRDDAGRVIPPRTRAEYFPVTYAEPATVQKVIGYDMLSEPLRRAALLKAWQTGNPVVTDRITLIDGEIGMILFMPVYTNSATNLDATVTDLQGFIHVVFCIQETIGAVIQQQDLQGLRITIQDESASLGKRFIAQYDPELKTLILTEPTKATKPSRAAATFCPAPTDCIRYLQVADRTWTLSVQPTSAYVKIHSGWEAEERLAMGILLTIGFMVYMLLTQRYAQKVENLVHERTIQAEELSHALTDLRHAQTHLIQTEKMSSLGQLVAGVAHEINNPVNFIHGNLDHVTNYTQDLLSLVTLYQRTYPQASSELQSVVEEIDLEFLTEDLPRLLKSMQVGTDRIRQIVLSLRNFSRLDEADMKAVDIHEGIDNTLMILQNRTKARPNHEEITIVKHYGKLPLVECYAGQLNQVFMNIISNAIDALEEASGHPELAATTNQDPPQKKWKPNITIRTELLWDSGDAETEDKGKAPAKFIRISITDNGTGMDNETQRKLFDPFFTTKPVGKGTGLGLAISYQIATEKHNGRLWCQSALGQGTTFFIEIPICQNTKPAEN
jgi:signal transduction histidine kinase